MDTFWGHQLFENNSILALFPSCNAYSSWCKGACNFCMSKDIIIFCWFFDLQIEFYFDSLLWSYILEGWKLV